MNKRFIVLGLILVIAFSEGNGHALPKYGVSMLESPNKKYFFKLADTNDRWTYQLEIFRDGLELAHYRFLGELVSACWSPSLNFVAVNNHYGHAGIEVWIISLGNGSVLSSHGAINARDYNFYADDNYFPNLRNEGAWKLKQIYPQVETDELRNGYTSVAYGWRGDDQLLMFHEFGFDNLSAEHHLIIQALTTWHVTDQGVSFQGVRFRKARDDQYEPMPPEARKTLNFIP